MPRQEQKWKPIVKKLDTAAHNFNSMGCDAANNNLLNPQNVIVNKPLQSVTFTGRVENYETEIVIDSGSGVTLMSLDLFNLINRYARMPLK